MKYKFSKNNYMTLQEESQEAAKISLLTREYFVCTHGSAIFATVNNIYPYKVESDPISGNIEKCV